MTLVKTENDYKVTSDIGNEYYIYEMVTIGKEVKTTGMAVIMYRGEETDKVIDHFCLESFQCANGFDDLMLEYISKSIKKFESENF